MTADVTRGIERLPIQCINTIDDEPHPEGFTYIAHSDAQQQLSSADGCCCTGRRVDDHEHANAGQCSMANLQMFACRCSAATRCPCQSQSQLECGSACHCTADCGRRVSQQGLSTRVQLRKGAKGWSVHAAEPIQAGSFVATYVGEYVNR